MFSAFLSYVAALPLEVVNLALYCAQEFGMALGVGGETAVLVAYLIAVRDGIIDDDEARFAKGARAVAGLGVFLVLASGAGVLLVHYLNGQAAVALEPAFLFVWSLVSIVFFLRVFGHGRSIGAGLLEGFSAATWYALFLVHILAPTAGWSVLGVIYGSWVLGFVLFWTALVLVVRGAPGVPSRATLANRRQQNYVVATASQPPYMPYQAVPPYPPPAAVRPPTTVQPIVTAAAPAVPVTAAPTKPNTPAASSPVPAAAPEVKVGLSQIQVMPRSASEIK